MAKFHFKYGAMNSGKSRELIRTAHNYSEQGLDVVVMKPSTDTKIEGAIAPRGANAWPVDVLIQPEMDVQDEIHRYMAVRALKGLDCILADESQFFQPRHIDELYKLAKLDDISVIAFGLKADFQTRLFPGSMRALELADNIEKISTMCRCGNQGEHNTRKINGIYVFEGDQVAIDGEDEVTYESLCGTCRLGAEAKALAA